MKFRYTNKELEEARADEKKLLDFIRSVIVSRKSDCTNIYAPLYKTLFKAETYIQKLIEKK